MSAPAYFAAVGPTWLGKDVFEDRSLPTGTIVTTAAAIICWDLERFRFAFTLNDVRTDARETVRRLTPSWVKS